MSSLLDDAVAMAHASYAVEERKLDLAARDQQGRLVRLMWLTGSPARFSLAISGKVVARCGDASLLVGLWRALCAGAPSERELPRVTAPPLRCKP